MVGSCRSAHHCMFVEEGGRGKGALGVQVVMLRQACWSDPWPQCRRTSRAPHTALCGRIKQRGAACQHANHHHGQDQATRQGHVGDITETQPQWPQQYPNTTQPPTAATANHKRRQHHRIVVSVNTQSVIDPAAGKGYSALAPAPTAHHRNVLTSKKGRSLSSAISASSRQGAAPNARSLAARPSPPHAPAAAKGASASGVALRANM